MWVPQVSGILEEKGDGEERGRRIPMAHKSTKDSNVDIEMRDGSRIMHKERKGGQTSWYVCKDNGERVKRSELTTLRTRVASRH